MKRATSIVFAASALTAACTPYSETVGAAAPLGTVWELETVNGLPAASRMTLTFLANGKLQGLLPCNSYTGEQSAPLPWFEIEKLAVTLRSCPALPDEQSYLAILKSSDYAEVAGDSLLLSDVDENSLYFVRRGNG
ncbi:META domain-containing protein [Algicella marina]|uniref:META domain-containing protein n=1 Tax=Algicella marina TaxID=2683284 RepID=A0A6P1T5V5_9RHOB|nr:META domain-containing protein [Algicella marina]QHQ37083.1 META domain-containing protein [Algicella marina]